MSDMTIDSLRIEAKTNIKDAINDIEALKQSLSDLGQGTSGVEQYRYAVDALTQKLSKLNGIMNKSGQNAVRKAIEDTAKAYMDFESKSKNVAATQEEIDHALENVQDKISSVSQAIAANVRAIRETSEESRKLIDYINGISGKIRIGPVIKSSFDPEEFLSMRAALGKKFTSKGDGLDFETFITNMNQDIGTVFDTTQGLDTVFAQLANRMKEIHNESKTLSVAEIFQRGLIPEKEIEQETTHFVAQLDDLKAKFNFSEVDLFKGEGVQLASLREQIKDITSAIGEKNKAFEKEQSIVNKVVMSELKDLTDLKASIDSITQAVSGSLTTAFDSLKDSGLADLALLKNIDFSGIAKINTKRITQTHSEIQEQIPSVRELIDQALEPIKAHNDFASEWERVLSEVNEASKQFFGQFYVPEDASELQSEFTAISEEIVRIKGVMQNALRTGETDAIKQLEEDLASAKAYFHDLALSAQQSEIALQQIPNEMEAAEEATRAATQSFNDLSQQLQQNDNIISRGTLEMPNFYEELHQMGAYGIRTAGTLETLADGLSEFSVKVPSVSKLIKSISSVICTMGKQMARFGKDFTELSWNFLNLGAGKSALSGLKNPLGQSSATISGFNDKLKDGARMLMRYGLGIRSLYVLFGKLRSGIQDGFNNLVQYSDRANQSISLLQADLSYLGNSVAAAFEPILNVVAPIIDQIVDYMVAGINSVGAFIAAITGQSTYTVAVKNIKSYRESLSGAASAGDAASDATDKVKDSAADLKRELMGFDEIEKFSEDLDNAANSGSGSGSGSGNGSGTEDPILFVKKDIPGAVSNFADLVKDAWAKSDFTDIGKIVGTKLRDALDSIDWEPIKEQANKIAKVTGTFINGFFETEGLDKSVGRILGEAVNTAVGAINTFVDTTHWTSLGEFMSNGLRSAIATIDWNGLGKTLNAKYKALWSFLDGFVVDMSKINFSGTTGWQEAGNALASTINSIFADRDYTKIGQTIAVGINGITSILDTSVSNIKFEKISQKFATGVNSIFSGVDFNSIGATLSNGLNRAISSLHTISITVDWIKIGNDLADAANSMLANTDFRAAGEALGGAFKNALSAINEFAATFNWRSLGVDINNFIKGINWGEILKTSANIVVNTFFGLFEAAWGLIFGGNDTKYTAIADNLNKAISKLNVEWPKFKQDELSNFDSAMDSLDKFWEINEKFKKNGSLSAQDESLFKFYYEQISKYAPDIAKEIGSIQTAYQGTKDTLEKLIETQKNAAIQKGFSSALEDASKIYGDAVVALEQLKTKFIDDSVSWKADILNGLLSRVDVYGGTIETWEKTFDKFLQKVRDGSIDFQNLTEDEEALWQVMREMNPQFGTMEGSMESLNGTVETSGETVDKLQVAMGHYRDNTSSATTNTESLIQKLKGIELTGVWKSLADELKNTLDDVTEMLKRDDFTLGISNTLTDMFDKEFKVKLKVGGLDTSKLTEQDKTIQGASASIVNAKNALPDYMKSLDFTAALTQKKDSISDRTISDLKGSISQVSQTGGLTLDNLGGWIGYIGSKTNLTLDNIGAWINYIGSQKSNMTLSDIGAWISYIGSQKDYMTLSDIGAWINYIGSQKSNMTLSDIGAWISFIGSQKDYMTLSDIGAWISYIAAQSGGLTLSDIGAWINYIAKSGNLSLSGINGLVNQVEKQPGSSLILNGIHGIVSSIANIFAAKAEGGAFYSGNWHSIPQFSSGGVITKDFMSGFSAIPRYAGGTVNAGSMFIAGEAGPELVGHVGGRTEVLNQSQLASVMQSAVASGMEAVMARYGGNGGGNENVTVNVVLQGDAKKIFEVVKKENNSRVIQTGKAQLLT